MKLLVDAKLDSGQRIQSITVSNMEAAASIARDMALRQMVVSADMLDTQTGEVLLVFTRLTVRAYIDAFHSPRPLGGGGVPPA